jgi:hypothetical protein
MVLKFLQSCLRQFQKSPVVALEGIGRQGFKCVGKLLPRLLQESQFPGRPPALFLQLCFQFRYFFCLFYVLIFKTFNLAGMACKNCPQLTEL